MNDNYQAVYDAVRSRIGSVDVQSAVERAFDFSYQKDMIVSHLNQVISEFDRPSVIYQANLYQTDDGWKAEYGSLEAFGRSPAEAMANFDTAWRAM